MTTANNSNILTLPDDLLWGSRAISIHIFGTPDRWRTVLSLWKNTPIPIKKVGRLVASKSELSTYLQGRSL